MVKRILIASGLLLIIIGILSLLIFKNQSQPNVFTKLFSTFQNRLKISIIAKPFLALENLIKSSVVKQPANTNLAADLAEANNAQVLGDNQIGVLQSDLGQPVGQPMITSINLPDGSSYSLSSKSMARLTAFMNLGGKQKLLTKGTGATAFNLTQPLTQSTGVNNQPNENQSKGKIANEVKDQFKSNGTGTVPVFIHLANLPNAYNKNEVKTKQQKFKDKKNKVLGNLKNHVKSRNNLPIINMVSADIDQSAIALLEADNNVDKVELVTVNYATLDTSVDQIHGKDVWPLLDSNDKSITGFGQRIAVLDTGVNYLHPDLGGCLGPNCKVIGGYDFINKDSDPMDDHGHGTHVAATAAGKGVLYGVAPDANILAYKVLNSGGSGATDGIAAAVQAATDPNGDGDTSDHVNVGTMSLGGGGNPDDPLSLAVDASSEAGVVWTIAAGNSGPYDSTIGSPGTARSAITVAAACKPDQIGKDGHCSEPIASFSSRGPLIWQGEDIKKPDISAPGVNICAARWDGAFSSAPTCFDNQHVRISGTSMATPHVAGAAALVRQAYPSFTPAQVKERLKSTADSLGMDYKLQGAGLVNLKSAIGISPRLKINPYVWEITSNPTIKTFSQTQQFTVTPIDSDINTLDVTSDFTESGIGISFDKTTLVVAGKTTDSFNATLTIDNDAVKWGYLHKQIILKSDGIAKGGVMIFLTIKPTIELSTPDLLKYGDDEPSLATWSSDIKKITVTNLRTDIPQSVSINNPDFGSAGITFNTSRSSFDIPANGSVDVDTQIIVDNSKVGNGVYKGNIVFTYPNNSLTVQAIFYKFFSLIIKDPSSTDWGKWVNLIEVDSDTVDFFYAGYLTQNPQVVYLPTGGNYNMTITHIAKFISADGYQSTYNVAKEGISVTSNTTINTSQSDANHTFQVVPTDENGNVLNNLDNYGTLLARIIPGRHMLVIPSIGGCTNCTKNYYSDLSSNYYVQEYHAEESPRARQHFFWNEAKGGLSSDKIATNTPSDLKVGHIQSNLNANPTVPTLPFITMWFPPVQWAGLDWYFGGGGTDGTKISSRYQTIYSNLSAGASLEHESDISRGSCDTSLKYCPSQFILPNWDLASNRRFWLTSHDTVPDLKGDTVYSGLGPSYWSAKFKNLPNQINVGKAGNSFGFLRQDYSLQEYDATPFTLWRNGNQVYNDKTFASTIPGAYNEPRDLINAVPTDTPGIYEFKIDSFAYQIKSQDMNAKVDAKFNTSATDPNPPSIKRLYFFTNDIRSEVYNETAPNRLEFEFDPVGGTISQAKASYSTNGTNFVSLAVNSGTNGYSVDIPALQNLSKITFKIEATDSTNNSLAYTFELPRGEVPSTPGDDKQPPVTLITDPVNGKTITDPFYWVKASAADNFEVSKVELYYNDKLIGITKNYPYRFLLETKHLKNGSYILKTKAYDAKGNVGESAPVSITINTDESWGKAFVTSPVEWDTVSGKVTISADVYSFGTNSIAYVKFYVATDRWPHSNQTLIGQANSAPYEVTWDITAIPPGDYYVYAQPYFNEVCCGPGSSGYTYERHVTVTAPPAIMTKTASPTTVSVGSKITYNIKIENPNNDTMTNLRISDPISSDTEYIDKSATAGGTYASDSRLVSWVIPSLGPKASIEVQFQVNVIK